jgi:hypothetical protein
MSCLQKAISFYEASPQSPARQFGAQRDKEIQYFQQISLGAPPVDGDTEPAMLYDQVEVLRVSKSSLDSTLRSGRMACVDVGASRFREPRKNGNDRINGAVPDQKNQIVRFKI